MNWILGNSYIIGVTKKWVYYYDAGVYRMGLRDNEIQEIER